MTTVTKKLLMAAAMLLPIFSYGCAQAPATTQPFGAPATANWRAALVAVAAPAVLPTAPNGGPAAATVDDRQVRLWARVIQCEAVLRLAMQSQAVQQTKWFGQHKGQPSAQLMETFRVEALPDAAAIQITAATPDPAESAVLANEFAMAARGYAMERRQTAIREHIHWAMNNMILPNEKLDQLRKGNTTAFFLAEADVKALMSKLYDLADKETQVEADLSRLEKDPKADAAKKETLNGELTKVRNKLLVVREQLDGAREATAKAAALADERNNLLERLKALQSTVNAWESAASREPLELVKPADK